MTIDEPRFTDQTNSKLRNAEVKSFVEKVCEAHLERWLEANPTEAKIIVNKAISSYEARIMPRRIQCRGDTNLLRSDVGLPRGACVFLRSARSAGEVITRIPHRRGSRRRA